MQLRLEKKDCPITLGEPPLAQGGEAYLYTVSEFDTILAKLYHTPTDELADKLSVMIAKPPQDPVLAHGHVSIAWPLDRIYTDDAEHRFVGFVMPRVRHTFSLFEIYNPKTRHDHCPLFHYGYLLRTARNLAAAFYALHQRGYVVGDVNESNILVSDTALVTLVDTDSFQVTDGERLFRCPVGKPEFTPPELQQVHFRDVDRLPSHDNFGLAVLIFLLLMEGTHPYAGRFTGYGDPTPLAERISAGHYPYGGGLSVPYEPMPFAPPIGLLHPVLRSLMRRCFETRQPLADNRPPALEWMQALDLAENSLTTCLVNQQHRYRAGFTVCPWCERTIRLNGWDPFPSREAVQGQHPLPAVGAGE